MKISGEMKTGLLFKISVWDSSTFQLVSEMPGSKSEAAVVPRCLGLQKEQFSIKEKMARFGAECAKKKGHVTWS